MGHLLLGLDIGSSSVKASIVDADTGLSICAAQSPANEMAIEALKAGWAEQDPEMWWEHVLICVRSCLQKIGARSKEIMAIGISYQMHGLVLVDSDHKPLRKSIIWCDSRAVEIGLTAEKQLTTRYCLERLLNAPGNFTASKLKWVKENEPQLFDIAHKAMLPGDYIALKFTGEILTTDSGLSEGIFWDYTASNISTDILDVYGIPKEKLPPFQSVFSLQGQLRASLATELGLTPGIKISYRAGDQPNNALSLNVLKPGETAATAGTSGVIYSVTDQNVSDPNSRVNTFIHVNNSRERISNGVLLCINGTGILNSWLRKSTGSMTYEEINKLAASVPIGADGLTFIPFGNGAERVLQNRTVSSSLHHLNFNTHGQSHAFRAAQEGIAFALRYGFDVLRSMGLKASVIKAGYANMFLSPVFRDAFVNTINVPLQLYNTDGATGAAIGAGIGAGIFNSYDDAFKGLHVIAEENPIKEKSEQYQHHYQRWKDQLEIQLSQV